MDAKNYGPISITCAFSKIFEKKLHAQITERLDKFQIMTPFQFGFRKNISTQDALVYVTALRILVGLAGAVRRQIGNTVLCGCNRRPLEKITAFKVLSVWCSTEQGKLFL